MAQQEGELIAQAQIKEGSSSFVKGKAPYPNAKEWVFLYLRSSSHQSANTHIFRDQHSFCRDAIVPNTNGYELFWYFYKNRVQGCLISNPWEKLG